MQIFFLKFHKIFLIQPLISQNMQDQFIQLLKTKSPDSTSFADEIASFLDIGYDEYYRRIYLKTYLTL
jgi:transcriptional antiterminator